MKRLLWLLALGACGDGGAKGDVPDAAEADAPIVFDAAPPADAPAPIDARPPDARPFPDATCTCDAPQPDAPIPVGDPLAADQTFTSANGTVTLVAHKGARLPLAGLTVELIEASKLSAALQVLNPTFGVRILPEGVAYDPPLDLEIDVGAGNAAAGGFVDVNRWDVFDSEFDVPAELSVRRSTVDREVIRGKVAQAHDLAFIKMAPGLRARVDEPAYPVNRLQAPLGARLTAENATAALSATVARGVTSGGGALTTASLSPVSGVLAPGQQDGADLGSFKCTAKGKTALMYAVTASDWKQGATSRPVAAHGIDRLLLVTCADIYGTFQETVSGDTTTFTTRVYMDDGVTVNEITGSAGVSYQYTLEATCGSLVDVAGAGKKGYKHNACQGSLDATIQVVVTVGTPGVSPVIFQALQFARSGEGQPATTFR